MKYDIVYNLRVDIYENVLDPVKNQMHCSLDTFYCLFIV